MFEPFPAQVEIVPAILPKHFTDLKDALVRVRGAAKRVQVDVVDGIFAKNKTWPYKDHATFEKIAAEEEGLPLWDEFDFEFDLMIKNPETRVMEFVRAGASRIVVHAAAAGARAALEGLADVREKDDGPFSVKTGVALLPDMQPDALEAFDAFYDFVQVMGIARVGYQGEPFDKRAVYLVERLRQRYPMLAIQVDGAVSKENAGALAKAGANRLIVGHDIWDAEDPKKEIALLLQIANPT